MVSASGKKAHWKNCIRMVGTKLAGILNYISSWPTGPNDAICIDAARPLMGADTVELSRTKLRTLPPLVLGGIIENQNSDFVMQ